MAQDAKVMLPAKSNILWTRKTVTAAINKRALITEEQAKAGKKLLLTVRGNGNWIDVRNGKNELVQAAGQPEGTVLRKKIFNVFANSDVAMRNPRNKALLSTAIEAEKKGEAQKAADYYNAFMNAIEVSFSVLDNQSIVNQLENKMDISAKAELVTTENGSLITLDASTIRIVEPEAAAKTTFSIDDFFGSEADATPDAVPASELAALSA